MAALGLFGTVRIQEVQLGGNVGQGGKVRGRATRGVLRGRPEDLVFGRRRRQELGALGRD